MSGGDAMSERHDCGEEAAAFALGALEPDEAERFERHVASCVVCRDEVAAFRALVELLPMTVPQFAAPKPLRRRLLRALRAEPRQVPAEVSVRRRPRLAGLRVPSPAVAVASVLAAALLATGAIELAGAGGTRVRVFQARVSGPGTAQLRVAGGRAELVVRRLPPPPPGHVYEVWLQRGQRPPMPTSTLFSVTSAGSGDVGVPQSLHGVSRVMVTPEPAGGSLVPTHAPVIVAQLT